MEVKTANIYDHVTHQGLWLGPPLTGHCSSGSVRWE